MIIRVIWWIRSVATGWKMNQIDSNQLTHPELLSEATLREILENRCIVLPKLKNLSKEELVEIFKRLALPLPQRQYDKSRHLGRMLNDLRTKNGVEIADYSDNFDHRLAISHSVDNHKDSDHKLSAKDRPKPSTDDDRLSCKKNRLSNSCNSEMSFKNYAKRGIEDSTPPDLMKRLKITWP